MRNIFDQYNHPENRLTHALVSSLSADPALLKNFIKWITGEKISIGSLKIVEQRLPGKEDFDDKDEIGNRGLPDGWIYDTNGWALLIESKIESPLSRDQLQRHRLTAERRGFSRLHLLALVTDLPNSATFNIPGLTIKKWTHLYYWLIQQEESEWASRLAKFMEVLELKLVRDDYLRGGTLTLFTGIPFGKDEPYNYYEAKRLLRLALDDLRKRQLLQRELNMDPDGKGRSAITGRESTRVWDFLRLMNSKPAENFTEFPHLTLSIQQEQLLAIITIPHGIRNEFRKELVRGGYEEFCAILKRILDNFNRLLGKVQGASPWIEALQRRYPSQRSEPIIDAELQFDLRTGFEETRSSVKLQQQWLRSAYEVLANKHSNFQLGVGAIFPYERCPEVHTPEILNHVANVWLACKPLIEVTTTAKTFAAGHGR